MTVEYPLPSEFPVQEHIFTCILRQQKLAQTSAAPGGFWLRKPDPVQASISAVVASSTPGVLRPSSSGTTLPRDHQEHQVVDKVLQVTEPATRGIGSPDVASYTSFVPPYRRMIVRQGDRAGLATSPDIAFPTTQHAPPFPMFACVRSVYGDYRPIRTFGSSRTCQNLSRWPSRTWSRQRWFPRSLLSVGRFGRRLLPLRYRHDYAAVLHHGLPAQAAEPAERPITSSMRRWMVRTATAPSVGSSWRCSRRAATPVPVVCSISFTAPGPSDSAKPTRPSTRLPPSATTPVQASSGFDPALRRRMDRIFASIRNNSASRRTWWFIQLST